MSVVNNNKVIISVENRDEYFRSAKGCLEAVFTAVADDSYRTKCTYTMIDAASGKLKYLSVVTNTTKYIVYFCSETGSAGPWKFCCVVPKMFGDVDANWKCPRPQLYTCAPVYDGTLFVAYTHPIYDKTAFATRNLPNVHDAPFDEYGIYSQTFADVCTRNTKQHYTFDKKFCYTMLITDTQMHKCTEANSVIFVDVYEQKQQYCTNPVNSLCVTQFAELYKSGVIQNNMMFEYNVPLDTAIASVFGESKREINRETIATLAQKYTYVAPDGQKVKPFKKFGIVLRPATLAGIFERFCFAMYRTERMEGLMTVFYDDTYNEKIRGNGHDRYTFALLRYVVGYYKKYAGLFDGHPRIGSDIASVEKLLISTIGKFFDCLLEYIRTKTLPTATSSITSLTNDVYLIPRLFQEAWALQLLPFDDFLRKNINIVREFDDKKNANNLYEYAQLIITAKKKIDADDVAKYRQEICSILLKIFIEHNESDQSQLLNLVSTQLTPTKNS
jgi:hypothetical protein